LSAQQGEAAPSNWNVPNALTSLRLLMVPFFGWALLVHHGADNTWRWVAWAIFALAMVTDKVDGDLARKHGLVTDFGKITDPIADKAMTGMAFVGLSVIGDVWWWVTALVLFREWAVTLARLSIARHVVIAARQSGKVKTVAQTFALGLFVAPFHQLPGAWHTPGLVVWWVGAVLMGVAVLLTVTSGLEFARDAWRQAGKVRRTR
jgi:CDP-diacylglycerol--glycerol-3-phosphate 3-phosphatidyltransferase